MRRTGQQRGNRRGEVFPLRLAPDERAELERMHQRSEGPRGFGPWLVWAAKLGATFLQGVGFDRARVLEQAIPSTLFCGEKGTIGASSGNTAGVGNVACTCKAREALLADPAAVVVHGAACATRRARGAPVILDLCGGSAAWSHPYALAGYRVEVVTLPNRDVRTYVPPAGEVRGVLAAPPCTEFSIATNGRNGGEDRDFATALEAVCACLRIIALARPQWWALENPGRSLLHRWLGPARDTWEPFEFGDRWTKRTALWGNFAIPKRGPFVKPDGSAMARPTSADRAITPPGFARAFFEANP